MTHDDMVRVLCTIRPGAEWSLSGTNLVWLDQSQIIPTDIEMANALENLGPVQPILSVQDQLVALQIQVAQLLAAK